MSVPVVAFFNNRGGVGKTSLVYHVAWMCADRGIQVLAADLDPQSNLTAAFLDEEQFEEIWPDAGGRATIHGTLRPLIEGVGDVVADARSIAVADSLSLLPGDLRLSNLEDDLSNAWGRCNDGQPRPFRVMSAFWRVLQGAAVRAGADLVLMDLGPNLGSINRAAMVASDHVVIPVAPDLFSVQGLQNLGPTLIEWRQAWRQRAALSPTPELVIPEGGMRPAGYVVMQHAVRLDRPFQAYARWMRRIPLTYRDAVLAGGGEYGGDDVRQDPHCLALMKHYRSLMPMAQEARKPIFHLRPADGAIGGHSGGVRQTYDDFARLTDAIFAAIGFRARADT